MLNFTIDQNQFDELPEQLKEHYTELDGAFVLQANGESNESIKNLKNALERERTDRKSFESEVQKLSDSMHTVTTELATLRVKDSEMSLRSAIANDLPPNVRLEATEDLLLHAKNELTVMEAEDGSTSYTTTDGTSVAEWMGKLLEKKPHWIKNSVSGGARGGSTGSGMGPKTGSAESVVADVFKN
jgi:seryl-tRNA synthetase